MVSPNKWAELEAWMQRLGIEESDLVEKFIIGSGSGGQKLHKTASCVDLLHQSSKIRVKCQKTRSREQNRYWARRLLCERIDEAINEEKSKTHQRIEKIRRQKRKRSKRAKAKMLDNKAKVGKTKSLRKKPSIE